MIADRRIDVVVLTWNDGDQAAEAVRSGCASDGVQAAVWVVDNGSDVPFTFDDPAVVVHRSATNLGVSKGRRLGVALGDAPLVCFLDSDAVLAPGSLATLVGALAAHPDLGCVGPVFDGTPPRESGGRHPTLVRKLARAAGLTRRYAAVRGQGAPMTDAAGDLVPVEFVIGACQVFHRSAYDAVGGLSDEGLFGPEDVELCRRFRAAGRGVAQVHGSGVVHDARRAWKSPFSQRGRRHLVAVLRYYGGRGRR
ncbi:MAG: glycosyl transferase family 2 [Acidimicrobiales bacterium]|nr:glycosyl transferase family 2 [Acidimicrobiales bacterium]